MGFIENQNAASSSILPELLRRTLSLIEFYGRIDGKEQDLFELRLALIRAIDRLEADQASSAAAARGEESAFTDRDGLSHRKQPAGETISIESNIKSDSSAALARQRNWKPLE